MTEIAESVVRTDIPMCSKCGYFKGRAGKDIIKCSAESKAMEREDDLNAPGMNRYSAEGAYIKEFNQSGCIEIIYPAFYWEHCAFYKEKNNV